MNSHLERAEVRVREGVAAALLIHGRKGQWLVMFGLKFEQGGHF